MVTFGVKMDTKFLRALGSAYLVIYTLPPLCV